MLCPNICNLTLMLPCVLVKLQEEAGEHSTIMELADLGSSDPEEAIGDSCQPLPLDQMPGNSLLIVSLVFTTNSSTITS